MSEKNKALRGVEEKLVRHFSTTPEADKSAVESSVRVAIAVAAKSHVQNIVDDSNAIVNASVFNLVIAQLRATRGLVWIVQAIVVLLTILALSSMDQQAYKLGIISSASAILAGITVAGILYDKNSPFMEMCYSFHFDYRQTMLVRLMVYGFGDMVGLSLLTVLGSSLAPFGLSALSPNFGDVLLCSSLTFFFTGFVCFSLLARYHGDASLALCFVFSILIAITADMIWSYYAGFVYGLPTLIWLVLLLALVAAILLSAHRLSTKINASLDCVSKKSN